ncbi:MAG TPA: hypothetical protein DEQ34_01035 [Balneolaceae bacterium]|nr:hypothetical protein [Balneolaceae bacterium]|tara:strand:- start:55845 stop:57407 length:1563 start_codon:yes stop_codon:yes gene_type:complete
MDQGEIDFMIRIQIGVIDLTPSCRSLLDQIGCEYAKINFRKNLSQEFSLILLNGSVTKPEFNQINKYVNDGGATIEFSSFRFFYGNNELSKKYRKLIFNESESAAFSHLSHIEFYSKVALHSDKSFFDGLIHISAKGNGVSGFMGYNPEQITNDFRYHRKRFFFKESHHPDEMVSKTDKKAVSELLTSLMKELHFRRDLPFVTKWTSPVHDPVFTFRIDSDFGTKESIDRIYRSAEANDIPVTWFLHVKAHEDWLDYFKRFKSQEIALHGYEHGHSRSTYQLYDNIERGLQLLRDHQLDPMGYCAPYGIWSEELATVLEKFDFQYTSEFTFSFDGIPLHPVVNGQISTKIQIPIHPVCTGSLSRKRVPVDEMEVYFDGVIKKKKARFEALMLYHHPMQPGFKLFESMFTKIRKLGFHPISYSDFSSFWNNRIRSSFYAGFDPHTGILTIPETDTPLCIMADHNSFTITDSGLNKKLNSIDFKYRFGNIEHLNRTQVNSLHSDTISLIKTSILDWKNRIKL